MRPILAALAIAMASAIGAIHAAAPPASGFIDEMPQLQADARRPAAQLYTAPGRSLQGFDRVAIDPVQIWYASDSKYQGIEPNELAAVANGFGEVLEDRLEPRYAVVRGEGAGILGVRIAITNVHANKKKRGLMGYTPAGFLVGAVKDAASAGPNIDLSSAVIEAELLDADGQRLAVMVEPLAATGGRKGALTWKQIGEVLDAWAQRLRARLDADNAD